MILAPIKNLICFLFNHQYKLSRDSMRYVCMRCGKRIHSMYGIQEFHRLIKKEQTQYQNEREHANALTKEFLGSCSLRVQKERNKNAID